MAGSFLRFTAGGTHMVVGPTESGKTRRVADILRLKDYMIEGGEKIRNVVICFATDQPLYQKLVEEGVVTRLVNKMPTRDEFIEMTAPYKNSGGSIVVIDDFMSDINRDLEKIIICESRHNLVSTFVLFQNLFPWQKHARQISLNVKYIHILKNPRENQQIGCLARQICLGSAWRWVVKAYHDATTGSYSCFLVDLTQKINGKKPYLKYRSHYLPPEWPMRVYVEKGSLPAGAAAVADPAGGERVETAAAADDDPAGGERI